MLLRRVPHGVAVRLPLKSLKQNAVVLAELPSDYYRFDALSVHQARNG